MTRLGVLGTKYDKSKTSKEKVASGNALSLEASSKYKF